MRGTVHWPSRLLCSLVLLLTALAGCHRRIEAPSSSQPVKMMLPELRGGALALSDYRGTPVLLHFWASWCIPCAHELEVLQHFERQVGADKVRVVSVAIESDWDAVNDIIRSRRILFPVGLDRSGAVREAFALRGVPQTLLLDAAGCLMPLPDPAETGLADAVIGPREWAKPAVVERYRSYLAGREP